jgi:hypothetical protein
MTQALLLEFIFFHREPYQRFKSFLQENEIDVYQESTEETDVEGMLICIEDNLDDDLNEAVEDFYDDMMTLSEQLVADAEGDEMSKVGLAVSLNDGRSVLASVDPDVLNRILTVISHQELGRVVDAIADAVENPDERPLCKRV